MNYFEKDIENMAEMSKKMTLESFTSLLRSSMLVFGERCFVGGKIHDNYEEFIKEEFEDEDNSEG